MTRFAALREYFDPDVRVNIDGQEIVTRDALIRVITQCQAAARRAGRGGHGYSNPAGR